MLYGRWCLVWRSSISQDWAQGVQHLGLALGVGGNAHEQPDLVLLYLDIAARAQRRLADKVNG